MAGNYEGGSKKSGQACWGKKLAQHNVASAGGTTQKGGSSSVGATGHTRPYSVKTPKGHGPE